MASTDYPPNISANDRVILFDGVCKLCNFWSQFIIKYDVQHRFKLCSVQSPEGQKILAHFGMPTDYFETMLYVEGNQCFEKSDVFLKVMAQLKWPFRLLTVFKFIPKRIRDWFYDRIALNRYALFGKYDRCILPEPDQQKRFLVGKVQKLN